MALNATGIGIIVSAGMAGDQHRYNSAKQKRLTGRAKDTEQRLRNKERRQIDLQEARRRNAATFSRRRAQVGGGTASGGGSPTAGTIGG